MRILTLALSMLLACGGSSPAQDGSGPDAADMARPPVCSGRFYPADPGVLEAMVDSLLEPRTSTGSGGAVIAGVVPHAGYVFSGGTAADFYSAIRGEDIDVVVLVGPSHQVSFPGFSVFQGGSYLTPLGEVPVEQEISGRLLASHPAASFVPAAHEAEHCLEVQLPFLQRVLEPGFSIVPIIVGSADEDQLRFMAELILAEAFQRRILVIASCDLSHYPPEELAREVDSMTVAAILAGDAGAFLNATSQEALPEGVGTFACGRLPVALVMYYTGFFPGMEPELLSMTTSADFSGDGSQVVGYASILFTSQEPDPAGWSLSVEMGDMLMGIARGSVEAAVDGTDYSLPADLPRDLTVPRGAFVTLKRNGLLRGCVGSILAVSPLAETVADMARSAALEDPRFIPVSPAELEGLEYEISVLTPLQIVDDWRRVRVGTDGLLVVTGDGRSGVLLPQVPLEQGWDLEEFLQGVCLKAGLSPEAYLGDVLLYRFQAQVLVEGGSDTRRGD
ncbi:MAG: AmmeMemoRadiSam system protein B [Candidatus Fermentibacteraceae bacterium]|nr:AmmeMemoRadiSam system protein B [Candidatus Fermentibacteraceae bacterium]